MNNFEKDTLDLMRHLRVYADKYGNGKDKYIVAVSRQLVMINNNPSANGFFDVSDLDSPYQEALNGRRV